MPRSSHSVTSGPIPSRKREPNGNRSLTLAYIQGQCGSLFRRGFSLVAHREKLYVRTQGTKVPLFLDLSAPWQDVQRRAGELQEGVTRGSLDLEEWRLRICGPSGSGALMSRDELTDFWRNRKAAEGVTEETWKVNYKKALERLDPRRPLSSKSLMQAIGQTEPGSRNRTRVVGFYRQLALATGHEWNSALLDPLQMAGYRATKRPIPIFSEREIEELVCSCMGSKSGPWWRVVALLAIYGLRPWEAWCAEPSKNHPGCVWIPVGKRNSKGCNPPREVPPFHPHWLELFGMKDAWQQELPVLSNKRVAGARVNEFLERRGFERGVAKSAYGFRNAYARRIHTPQYRVTDGDGAVFMGHTVAIHNATYRKWLEGYDDPIARYVT